MNGFDESDEICGTPFYVFHRNKEVWLGVLTPYGVLALEINQDDWKDWLRTELERCHPVKVPADIKEFIK